MGLLDSLTEAASNLPGASGLLNTAQQVTSLVMPVELENMMKNSQNLAERITKLEQDLQAGIALTHEVSGMRSYLTSFQNSIENGGEPAPDPATALRIKAMPQYQELKKDAQALEQRLQALEATPSE